MNYRFTFDGLGINQGDEYASRIATLNTKPDTFETGQPVRNPEHLKLGQLLAASPKLAVALAAMLKVSHGRLERNPYMVPEYKAGLLALCEATGHRTDKQAWMDVDLDKIIAEFSPE